MIQQFWQKLKQFNWLRTSFFVLVLPWVFWAPAYNLPEVHQISQPASQKLVYLTFDADMTESMQIRAKTGQIKFYDQRLVDYLENNKIPALIFTTGLFVQGYPDVIKQLAADQLIQFGNHTYDHPGFAKPCYKLKILNNDQDKIAQINKTQEIIKQATGQTPKYFRFPGLCHTAHDDGLVMNQGLKIMDGDIVSGDAFNSHTASIVNNIMKNVKPGDVILMHVGGPNAPKAFEVLANIVPKLQAAGYGFGTK